MSSTQPDSAPPVATMDDFAQTRGADDLFDGEISAPPRPPASAPTEPRGYSARGDRGDRGDRGVWARGSYQRRGTERPQTTEPRDGGQQRAPHASQAADRTLSGGVKKPKLTEEELAERMARVKLNNERLTERRRKAEEDESTFQELEAARKEADAAKRSTERKKRIEAERNRKELDDEREKNRQRKLKAVQNREWDVSKTEEDYNPKGYNPRYRRGAHGAVANSTPERQTAPQNKAAKPAEDVNSWPALPGENTKPRTDAGGWLVEQAKSGSAASDEKKEDTNTGSDAGKLPLLSPIGVGSSWAEQVEAGTPATPTS